MRELLDQGTSVLVNLGGLNPESQSFLGCFISTAVEEAALSEPISQRNNDRRFISSWMSSLSSPVGQL